MRLKLIIVGKDRGDPLCDAADEYLRRVERYFPTQLVEVKEGPAKSATPVVRIKTTEAERIQKAIGVDDWLIALDEHGKELTSVELANKLGKWANEGKQTITFVIGGPNGLDPE